ncbi:MAG TPA: hypothetical protein PKX23_14600 [Verrucomicrobiota bacterium]|jgi:hypothetical protein|nr:hypothetical protein [Verrucomicrobiota bacterium]HRT08947.1 hypothetical protein [Candidatus Paceibacterota bacterium]HRT57198.1 hypothetical protein [Candidatus Paceibacterota bacterium]
MSPLGFLLVAAILAVPIAWLVAEFRGNRPLRITLGLLSLFLVGLCVWGLCSLLTRFNYNAWYGGATGDLIKTSIHQIEDGHLDRVLKVWRGLDQQYQPTYENRAHYNELVEQANRLMSGEQPIEPRSAWDTSAFKSETWVGHWEDDNGYWLVVNDVGRPFDVVRSGDPPTKMQSVSVSPDYTVLKFKEGEQWSHTLKLCNKYEATHEWFDVAKGSIWKTDTMHKLIRAAEEQKKMTQQEKPASLPK